jgi:hypothetical protein
MDRPDAAAHPASRHEPACFWFALALGVVALKVLGLALDPHPAFFMGDSGSYLHTALTGWVPTDRSYWYGVVVAAIVGSTQSLTPLVIAQTMAGAATALLAAWWSHLVFRSGRFVLCVVAVACALEPSQLLFERYVLTESLALLSLALQLVAATHVIVRGRWQWMPLVVLAGVAVIALRPSLGPVVIAVSACAPMLARAAGTIRTVVALLAQAGTVILVAAVPLATANVYTGTFLLAAWSPLIEPSDLGDAALASRVLEGLDLTNPDLFTREANLWTADGLVRRLAREIPDTAELDHAARQAALSIAVRDPLGVAALAGSTYASVWNRKNRSRLMRWDVGQNPLDVDFRKRLASSFRLVVDERPQPTLTSRHYLKVGSWAATAYLLAPILLLAVSVSRPPPQRNALILMAVASAVILASIAFLATLPVVRYLQPIGWMVIAGCVPGLAGLASAAWRPGRKERSTS